MDERWDARQIARLARLAGLEVPGAEEAAVLAAELAEMASLMALLLPAGEEPTGTGARLPGPAACPLRDDVVAPPPREPWPPAASRDASGMLPVPPVLRREDDDG